MLYSFFEIALELSIYFGEEEDMTFSNPQNEVLKPSH